VSQVLDILLVLLVLTTFLLLGSSRLAAGIRIGALQGVMVGLLPLAGRGAGLQVEVVALGVGIIGLKGFVFPRLLSRALRESDTRREVEPFVGYIASLFVGVLLLLGAFALDARLEHPAPTGSSLFVPVALAMMMAGLFLIVARRTAMGLVIGYLPMENGIYCFGLAMVRDIPLLIELGALMDLFVAVFVMGIAIYRINREFDHIDSDRLSTLRG
jgi:hydrogenase-4 component E